MGYPTRPSRSAFGPTYTNKRPVIRPDREVDAGIGNLLFWQVAGQGVAGNVAFARIDWDGASLTLGVSGEAWDANESTQPTLSNPALGHYRLVYAASYADELGNPITTNLFGAAATPQTSLDRRATAKVANDHLTVDVYLRDAAGADVALAAGDSLLVAVF